MRTLSIFFALGLCACGAAVSGAPDEGDRDAAANHEALLELRARGAAERAAEGSASTSNREVPPLPTEVLRPVLGPPALTEAGELRREALEFFHDRGPHALLGAVVLTPVTREGSTLGFAIGDIAPTGQFILDAGLRQGDVVRSVNGRSIVLPDEFMTVFDSLPTTDRIDVVILRGDETVELGWAVVDDR